MHRNTTPNTIILGVHKSVDSSNTNNSIQVIRYNKSSMVERKGPHLGLGVVLGDGHDIQASRPKQLSLVLLPS
jgi:hypothetical protein